MSTYSKGKLMGKLEDHGILVDPVIEVYKKSVDRTLLRENLALTIEERFQRLQSHQQFAEELQKAGRQARRQR